MTTQLLFDNFDLLADTPNGVAKLRELILQLAMQGKLVKQDPNDEPASVLLGKIQKEKARLIVENKIKKSNPLPPIRQDEIPFELPKGWEWTRLGSSSELIRGVSYKKQDASTIQLPNYLPILRANNINGAINYDDLIYIPIYYIAKEQYPMKSDVLIAMSSGSKALVGKAAQIDKDFDGGFGAFCGLLRFCSTLDYRYISWFLQSPLYREAVSGQGQGIGINNLQKDKVRQLLMPLPPLAEQRHIVDKVDELMALCNDLEEQKKKKQETHTTLNESVLAHMLDANDAEEFAAKWQLICDHFELLYDAPESVSKLRSAILQLAVQGKLVKQDPKDEPASVLLEKIHKEKVRLIVEKKIKKSEPLPPIKKDEIPYELPEEWLWVRLGGLGITQTGTTPSTTVSEYYGNDFAFVKPADISNGHIEYRKDGLSKLGVEEGRFVPANSVMMVSIGGSIGKVGIVNRDCSCNQQINFISIFKALLPRFIYWIMKSASFYKEVISQAPSTILPILSKGKWDLLLVPLPPLNEQERIIKRLDQFNEMCDELEAKLTQAESASDKFTTAVVREMVEE
ncbi:MAG: restriction endonuclease subunit S [Bacteroidota bacterium]